MDTPRRGLIRATERAIEEYIKEGCEENLPMIRQLEDVAYQFWVESNTSFLNETVVTVGEDEDDWIWDEDCLLHSFSAHVEDCIQDDKDVTGCLQNTADDVSSICSSIKPCDESDCCLGYLASYEDSILSAHVSNELEAVQEDEKRTCIDIEVEISEQKDETSLNSVTEADEWVLVEDCTDFDSNNEWFIVSTAETKVFVTENNKHLNSSAINIRPVQLNNSLQMSDHLGVLRSDGNDIERLGLNTEEMVINEDLNKEQSAEFEIIENEYKQLDICKGESCNDDSIGSLDLSDWTVLSINVTERTSKHQTDSPKRKGHAILQKTDYMWQDHRNDHTFGTTISDGYGMSFGNCPLCKSKNNEKYTCAIFCVLMPR